MDEIIISRIEVRSEVLLVVYDKCRFGLFKFFSSDEEVAGYVRANTEKAFMRAVQRNEDGYCILNIASVEDLGAFEWDDFTKNLLDYQIGVYEPLIQKFIVDAATRTL